MNARHAHLANQQRTSVDRALDIAGTCGRLRERARTSSHYLEREALRALAKKIERRKELRLTVGWWLNKAEEMLRAS